MKRTAIIGLGRVAVGLEDDSLREKPCTHMGAYLASPDFEVVAGADIDHRKLSSFGERYGIKTHLYTDYREMLSVVKPEVVSITAYATERAEMLRDVINSGVKGVWCEKAFATSLTEADELVALAKERGTVVIVSHMRRWSAEHILVKKLLDDGVIGELKSISTYFSGSLLHTGTHAFDVLRWFAGDALWVEGSLEGADKTADSEGGEDKGFLWSLSGDPGGRAVIMFKNGVYAAVHAESKSYFLFEFDLIGTKGRIKIGNNDTLELHTTGESSHYDGINELQKRGFPGFEKENIWVGAAKNLSEAIDGKAPNMNPPEDGRGALELALAIHSSSSMKGQRVYLPLKNRSIKVNSR